MHAPRVGQEIVTCHVTNMTRHPNAPSVLPSPSLLQYMARSKLLVPRLSQDTLRSERGFGTVSDSPAAQQNVQCKLLWSAALIVARSLASGEQQCERDLVLSRSSTRPLDLPSICYRFASLRRAECFRVVHCQACAVQVPAAVQHKVLWLRYRQNTATLI